MGGEGGEVKAEIYVYAPLCIKSFAGIITRGSPRTFAIFSRKRQSC